MTRRVLLGGAVGQGEKLGRVVLERMSLG